MRELKSTELKAWLDEAAVAPLLLDVREPWEFERCHISGSSLIPMREVMLRMQTLDPDRETVVICHHGIRSRQICRMLESAGFSRLTNLADGIDGWARYVDPHMPTY